MSKTISESMAFVSHITSGKALVHFESTLGLGQVPACADFASKDEQALERCADFLEEITENVRCLQAMVDHNRGVLAQAQAAERVSYLPGLAPHEVAHKATPPIQNTAVEPWVFTPVYVPPALSVPQAPRPPQPLRQPQVATLDAIDKESAVYDEAEATLEASTGEWGGELVGEEDGGIIEPDEAPSDNGFREESPAKRGRGRPPGAKNKPKEEHVFQPPPPPAILKTHEPEIIVGRR